MKSFTLWPAIIVCSAALAGIFVFTDTGAQARVAVVLWFMFVCPGMMLVRLLRLREPLIEWTLAVAISLALDTFVAGLLMMAGHWSPLGAFAIVMSVTLVGALAQEANVLRAWSVWDVWSEWDAWDDWSDDDEWSMWNDWNAWGGKRDRQRLVRLYGPTTWE